MSRAESMATIDAALASGTGDASTRTMPTVSFGTTALLDPTIAPGVTAPAPLTDGIQKKPQAAEKPPKGKTAEEIQRDQQRQIDEQQHQEQEQRGAFQASAGRTTGAISGILNGAGVRLGSLPTPGSLMLPLVILLVFFMLLLPVNGHTRFTWLWMVITGDAMIGQSTGTPDVASGNTSGTQAGGTVAIESPALPGNTTAIAAPAGYFSGSYVEEIG